MGVTSVPNVRLVVHSDRRARRPGCLLRRRRGTRRPEPALEAARRRRRPAGPRGRRDRELCRAPLRHPLRDELRGGSAPLPERGLRASTPRPLPRALAERLVDDPRGRAGRRADRDRRGLSRPDRPGGRLPRGPATRRGDPDGRARHDEPDVLTRDLELQGRREDRERPAQARRDHRRSARPRGGVPRAARRPQAAGRRPARGAAAAPRGDRDDRRAGDALPRPAGDAPARQGGARASRPRARDRRTASPARLRAARLDQPRGDVRPRHRRARSDCTTSCAGCPTASPAA